MKAISNYIQWFFEMISFVFFMIGFCICCIAIWFSDDSAHGKETREFMEMIKKWADGNK